MDYFMSILLIIELRVFFQIFGTFRFEKYMRFSTIERNTTLEVHSLIPHTRIIKQTCVSTCKLCVFVFAENILQILVIIQ